MEGVTAFLVGPLCLVAVYAQWAQKPWRHTLQIILATCQAYGDINYYLTCWYEGEGITESVCSILSSDLNPEYKLPW